MEGSYKHIMTIEEQKTWRELLGKIITNAQERHAIAKALGVNTSTLIRWSTNKSTPHQDRLRQLLEILPQYRQQFATLIAAEFPHMLLAHNIASTISQEIPAAFYARI